MACKMILPNSGNVVTQYKGHYFCRRRHRNGELWYPLKWVQITKDLYEFFVKEKCSQVEPTQDIIDYVDSYNK